MKPKCLSNFREARACIAYKRKKFVNERRICSFIRCSLVNKSGVYVLELRKIWFIDEKANDECMAEFRFCREDIYELAVQLTDEITTYNDLVVALCLYLKSYAYPCKYGDLVFHFAKPILELSIITNHMMEWFAVGGTTCLQDTITIYSPFTSFSSMPTP